MNRLFKPKEISDRSETQLAFEANYFPAIKMRDQHKIAWSNSCLLTKQQILNQVSEDFTKLLLVRENVYKSNQKNYTPGQWFEIHWLFGNTPTYEEWTKQENHARFRADFRVSPLCKNGGKIVLLSMFERVRTYRP